MFKSVSRSASICKKKSLSIKDQSIQSEYGLFYDLNAAIPVSSLPAIKVFISYVPYSVYNASISVNPFIIKLSWVIPLPPRIYLPHRLIYLALSVTQAFDIPTIPIVDYPLDYIFAILQQIKEIA